MDEIDALRQSGYDPSKYMEKDAAMGRAVRTLVDGTFDDGGKGYFRELFDSLTIGASWHKPDHYFIMRDLADYVEKILKINEDFGTHEFTKKQFVNAASAAYFSSDRSIREYAQNIWELE